MPEDEDDRAMKRSGPEWSPFTSALLLNRCWQPSQCGEYEGEAVLGGGVLYRAAGIAEGDIGWEMFEHPLVADRQKVHMAQPSNAGHPGTARVVSGPLCY
jgi:hypothetical protein